MNWGSWAAFSESFLVLFVAIDIAGLLPIYAAIVADLSLAQKRRVLVQAVLCAGIVGATFFVMGRLILACLGITVADFQVAGGLLLVAFSLYDLVISPKPTRIPSEITTVAIVPLAIPLIVGPAVMTTSIGLIQRFGLAVPMMAFAANLLVTLLSGWFMGEFAERMRSLMLAASKVVSILLAAIGVKMIRMGFAGFAAQ